MSKQSDLVSVSQGSGGDPLYIDTTNDRVGVKTASPAAPLHVSGNVYVGGANSFTDATSGYFFAGNGSFANGIYGVGVNNVAINANGAERMRIDNAGRVTMPYQPAFRAQQSPSSVGGGGPVSGTAISYGNVIFNVGGHYNNTNGRFTAPVSGTYYFASSGYWVNDGLKSLAFWKNSVRMNEHYEDLAGNCFCLIYCNANDYVISSFGAAPSSFVGTGNYWSFEGYLIG